MTNNNFIDTFFTLAFSIGIFCVFKSVAEEISF